MITLIIFGRRPLKPLHRTMTALADWWHDLRTRSDRLDRRLMEWPPILAAAMSDRGLCDHCGHEHALKQDGRVRAHHDCPGGDQLPAPLLIRSD
jgi:hypothetical protein